jgi:hypothetical protein
MHMCVFVHACILCKRISKMSECVCVCVYYLVVFVCSYMCLDVMSVSENIYAYMDALTHGCCMFF